MKKVITFSRSKSVTSRISYQPNQSFAPNKKKQTILIPGMPQQEDDGKTWIIWAVVIGFVIVVITIVVASGNRRSLSYTPPPRQMPQPSRQPREENLWMGKWMKQNGAVSNADLRARQERIKRLPPGIPQ